MGATQFTIKEEVPVYAVPLLRARGVDSANAISYSVCYEPNTLSFRRKNLPPVDRPAVSEGVPMGMSVPMRQGRHCSDSTLNERADQILWVLEVGSAKAPDPPLVPVYCS